MTEERKLKKPTEGKPFSVYPKEINKMRFSLKRSNDIEEKVRQSIIAAFKAAEEKPSLLNPFETLIPERSWDDKEEKNGQDLLDFAMEFGCSNITDYIEQGFEWAQRLENGESWKEVCSEKEEFKSYIVILWEDGTLRYLGSSYKDRSLGYIDIAKPTYIDEVNMIESEITCIKTVPKVTLRNL